MTGTQRADAAKANVPVRRFPLTVAVTANGQMTEVGVGGGVGVHVSDTRESLTLPLNVPLLPFSLFASTALEAHVPESEVPSCDTVARKSALPTNSSFVVPTHVPVSDGGEGVEGRDDLPQPTAAASNAAMNANRS